MFLDIQIVSKCVLHIEIILHMVDSKIEIIDRK